MSNEKQSVALSSVAASALMTVGKFTVGIMTGSLGIISEGAHSLLDLCAALMTYYAVSVSDKPADEEHHYGHGKIENISAFAETGLLFLTSFWVLYEAGHRLIAREFNVEVTGWSIGVIVTCIIVDISRARALKHVAQKTRSQALEADALHFSSDVLSSVVVLIGLGFTAMGLPQADAFAAIGVALFVCHAGWLLGKQSFDNLTDRAPDGITEKLRAIVTAVPAVIRVNRLRVRTAGGIMFADVDIAVSRTLPLDRVNAIEGQILQQIQKDLPHTETTISVHPVALDSESLCERVHAIAYNQQLYIHHVVAHQIGKHLSVNLDLEIAQDMSLDQAHETASALERAIFMELGDAIEVETHIDPLQSRDVMSSDAPSAVIEEIKTFLKHNRCSKRINQKRPQHSCTQQ